MGVIQIRSRSANLGNLGGVRQADVNVGASEAIRGAYEAKQASRDANWNAGLNMLKTVHSAVSLGAKMYDDRQDRKADEYVTRYKQGMDAYNNGSVGEDGRRVKGAMEMDFEDSAQWLDENVDYRDRLGERLKKEMDMGDHAMQIAQRRLAGYNLGMQNLWQRRAADVDDRIAQGNANERFTLANETLLQNMESDDRTAVAASWAEWNDALENQMDRAHVAGDGGRSEFRRRAAVSLYHNALEARIRSVDLASASLAPEETGRMFDELAEHVRENGLEGVVPNGGTVINNKEDVVADYLRKDLVGVDMDKLNDSAVKQIKAAGTKAKRAAAARVEEGQNAAHVKTMDEMRQFIEQNPVPETDAGMKDYLSRTADKYDEFSSREGLSPQRRLAYKKAAETMRSKMHAVGKRKTGVVASHIASADGKTTWYQMLNSAIIAQQDLSQNGRIRPRTDEMGRPREWTAAEIEEQAMQYLEADRISPLEYTKLLGHASKAYDTEAKSFLKAATERIQGIMPSAFAYDEDINTFQAKSAGTGKSAVTPESPTGIKFRGRDAVLYSQAAEAMDLTFLWMQKYNKSADEGIKHFNDMMSGNVETYNRETIADTISAASAALRGRAQPRPAQNASPRTGYAIPTASGIFLPF